METRTYRIRNPFKANDRNYGRILTARVITDVALSIHYCVYFLRDFIYLYSGRYLTRTTALEINRSWV